MKIGLLSQKSLLGAVTALQVGIAHVAAGQEPVFARTPENQVFQFAQSGECSAWADGSKTRATAYLWIPEACQRLRGLLVLCANVPENMLVEHPAIREVCAAHDLGIIWCPNSFFNFQAKSEIKTDVAFLQQLLDGLAKSSGYSEVATVPWLPMGESGHLLMVDALVETAPERCIAGIWIKNCHLPPKNRQTPALVVFGSAQEWGQNKVDFRKRWNDIGGNYQTILNERKSHPDWPFSFVIDGESGHFDCSQRLTKYFAHYIDLVAKARLSLDGSSTLRPVDLQRGFLADLPVPGHENHPITAFSDTPENARAVPWFFDQTLAEEAQSIGRINWRAESQLPAFINAQGQPFPFTFNGITWISLNKKPNALPDGTWPPMIETEREGITFSLKGRLLEKMPDNFVGAGEPLAKAPGSPIPEWLCGAIEPLGEGKFRLAIDRNWPAPIYVALRQAGTATIRGIVQPAQIDREINTEGALQKISFDRLQNVKAGTVSVPLVAKADSGLPVRYFVVAGPALVRNERLEFTKVPPRSKFPITITVGAWQWGRFAEPKIQRAEIVRQSFQLLAPE